MPTVQFTDNLARQAKAPTCEVEGSTVREALDAVFAQHSALRGYVLDDQGEVRKHVVIFVNGTAIVDRRKLTDAVSDDAEIFVMQALSGG